MLHTFSLGLLITSVYQVPADNVLIRSLIQWDFFSPLDSCHIVVVYFFILFARTYASIFKARITIASVIKIYVRPDFFHRRTREGGFWALTVKGGVGEGEKKLLSAVVSNCVNPFKKDVFQFPGLSPPPIGSLPVHPHRHPVYTSWHLISYFRIINIPNACTCI